MKTLKHKIALLSITAFLAASNTFAQHRHEFSIWGEGGLSSLKYKTSFGKQKHGFGGGAGLGYTFFFSPNWGIGTGGEISLYNAKAKVDGLTDNYGIIDREDHAADYYMKFDNYTEKQRLISVNVPLFLQYQTGGKNKFYMTLGGKVGFPIKETFKTGSSQITAWAYYPHLNQTLYDPREEGYGVFNNENKADGDLSFKIAYMASAEAGMKWQLNDHLSLYTGAYIDYGLNNIRKGVQDKQFLAYNVLKPANFQVNSIMQSQYTNDGKKDVFVDKVKVMAAGIKIKLAFGTGGKAKKVEMPEPIVETRPIEKPAIDEEKLARERAEREAAEAARRKAEEEARAKAAALRESLAFVVDNFKIGTSKLTPTMTQIIDSKIEILKQNPELRVRCTGHTCDIGGEQNNLELGRKRANSVKDYMVSKGIDANRITIGTEGESNPAVSNTSNSNRLKNRRVVGVAID